MKTKCIIISFICLLAGSICHAQSQTTDQKPAPTVYLVENIKSVAEDGSETTKRREIRNLQRVRQRSLNASTEVMIDNPAKTRITVQEFTVHFRLFKKQDYICEGNKFSEEVIRKIRQLKSCDQFMIQDVKATDINGQEISIEPCMVMLL